MMKRKFNLPVVAIGAILMFSNCKKDQGAIETNSTSKTMSTTAAVPMAEDGEPTELGKKLENPYKLEHMQFALDSLNNLGINSLNPFTVRVTHKYIKYLPENGEELDQLLTDSNLFFYDYPLDYEIKVSGNFYIDPSIDPAAADSTPTPQYVVVPVDYSYNTTIPHQILEDLYIPEEDNVLLGAHLNNNLEFGNLLLEGAHRNAGTFLEPATPWGTDGGGGWAPAPRNGQIRVFDNRLNQFIPLRGVEITARRGMTTRSARTNANGDYYLTGDPFNRSAKYTIHFNSQPKFRINNRHALVSAKIVRDDISGNVWNHDIVDGTDRMHATMFRAAYRYYYGNIGSLKRPDRPNGTQHITSKQRRNGGAINYIVFPNITVAMREDGMSGREYDCDELFSATIHELAHTAHVKTMNNAINFSNVSGQIRESWATAVEWMITGMEYRERGIANYMNWNYNPTTIYRVVYPIRYGYQYWNQNRSGNEYTSLFINLVDNNNEQGQLFPQFPSNTVNVGTVNDQVSGYNLGTIQQNYLKDMYNKSSLEANLKANKPPGVTNAQIDLLLSFY